MTELRPLVRYFATRQVRNDMSLKLLLVLGLLAACSATPLDDYVNAPDPSYEYRDLGDPWDGDGYTSYFINLTSQLWLSREALYTRELLACSVLLPHKLVKASEKERISHPHTHTTRY